MEVSRCFGIRIPRRPKERERFTLSLSLSCIISSPCLVSEANRLSPCLAFRPVFSFSEGGEVRIADGEVSTSPDLTPLSPEFVFSLGLSSSSGTITPDLFSSYTKITVFQAFICVL